ncbi:MAG: hypothetical protein WAW99_02035 [Candidatus Bipolaricaulis anaerobius]
MNFLRPRFFSADTLARIRERLELQGYTWSQFRMIPHRIPAQP